MLLVKQHIERDGSGYVTLRPQEDEDMWHAYNLIQEVRAIGSMQLFALYHQLTSPCSSLPHRATSYEAQQSGAFDRSPLLLTLSLIAYNSRVTTESSTGSTSSHRVHLKLTIIVSKVLYSALAQSEQPSASSSTPSASGSTTPTTESLTTAPTTGAASSTAGTATLHVSGKVSSENLHVKKGAFHTLDLEVGRDFTIIKQEGEWDSIARERIREVTEPGRGAEVGAIVCGEGELDKRSRLRI
jgi:protein pelota